MSPITSHGECWVWQDAFVYMFKLNFNSHNSTKPDIPRLISHLNICHQSVAAVISGNQCNSGQLKCDCEGGTSLYSIMGNKTAACFLSKKKKKKLNSFFLLFFSASLYIGYLIQRKSKGKKELKPWGSALRKVWTVKENREGLHNGPRRQSWSFFIITKIKLHPLMVE